MRTQTFINILAKTVRTTWSAQKPWWLMLKQLSGLGLLVQFMRGYLNTSNVTTDRQNANQVNTGQSDEAKKMLAKAQYIQSRQRLCYWNIGLTIFMGASSFFFLGGLSKMAILMMVLYIAWMLMCLYLYSSSSKS